MLDIHTLCKDQISNCQRFAYSSVPVLYQSQPIPSPQKTCYEERGERKFENSNSGQFICFGLAHVRSRVTLALCSIHLVNCCVDSLGIAAEAFQSIGVVL